MSTVSTSTEGSSLIPRHSYMYKARKGAGEALLMAGLSPPPLQAGWGGGAGGEAPGADD